MLDKFKYYYEKNYGLMKHLHPSACWEYIISENTLEGKVKYNFFIIKEANGGVRFMMESPQVKPDLILYFTEKAILHLIQGNPSPYQYYERYQKLMNSKKEDIKLDSKINKPRMKLLKLGYRNWQKEFKF